jgi:hypothetical protein
MKSTASMAASKYGEACIPTRRKAARFDWSFKRLAQAFDDPVTHKSKERLPHLHNRTILESGLPIQGAGFPAGYRYDDH